MSFDVFIDIYCILVDLSKQYSTIDKRKNDPNMTFEVFKQIEVDFPETVN
jgi:hypothetical protein